MKSTQTITDATLERGVAASAGGGAGDGGDGDPRVGGAAHPEVECPGSIDEFEDT